MLTAFTIALSAAVLLHAAVFLRRRTRILAAEAARMPVGPTGVVSGAGSIDLRGSATHAALLVHGFGDTPQSLRLLAEYLHREHGWTVRVPLLAGHGRTLEAFASSDSLQWRADVHHEYNALRLEYAAVVLVGLSMGGALATIEAARDPELPALVLLAPYLTPPAKAERLAPLATVFGLLTPYLRGGDREASIFDPAARAQSLSYGAAPPRCVRELVAVAHDARQAATDVQAPTLLIHSRKDYRIPAALAEGHPSFFSAAAAVEQQWVDGCGHVITVDFCRLHVWTSTAAWLARFAGAPTLPLTDAAHRAS